MVKKDYIDKIKGYTPTLEKEISIVDQEIIVAVNFFKNGLLKIAPNQKKLLTPTLSLIAQCMLRIYLISILLNLIKNI
jgi:hypothetical protein